MTSAKGGAVSSRLRDKSALSAVDSESTHVRNRPKTNCESAIILQLMCHSKGLRGARHTRNNASDVSFEGTINIEAQTHLQNLIAALYASVAFDCARVFDLQSVLLRRVF